MRRNSRAEQSLFTVLHAGLSWIRLSYTYSYLKTKQASLSMMIYCLLCKCTKGGTNGSGSGRGLNLKFIMISANHKGKACRPCIHAEHNDAKHVEKQNGRVSKLSVCKYFRVNSNHAITTEIQICLKYLGKRPNSRASPGCKPGIAEAKCAYSSVDFAGCSRKVAKRESDQHRSDYKARNPGLEEHEKR